jgi:hypothetical protein
MEALWTFDVYCKVSKGSNQDAVELLTQLRPDLLRRERHIFVNRAAVNGSWMCFLRDVGWSDAQAFKASRPSWMLAVAVVLFNDDPSASDSRPTCQNHGVRFAGIIGCPVCADFYKR